MKHRRTYAVLFLLTTLAASGCDTAKPKPFSEVAKESAKDKDLREAAMKSDRTITVTVDAARNLYFRKEKVGTLDDAGPLKEKVRQAVEKNVRTDPSADGNNVVFFCAPADMKYGDVAGVLDAIKDAGGNPVGMTNCDPHPRK